MKPPETRPESDVTPGLPVERRRFLGLAAAAAAGASWRPAPLSATAISPDPAAIDARAPLGPQEAPPLGNGEPPALQFQPYPGGTGALMEELMERHGADAFRRAPVEVEPWSGAVPGDEEEVAFLPVHRLSALIRAGHLSSVDLTEIYLDRLRRYDPELLFAVTILDGLAREQAQQADADLRAGRWRGPLHGIPYGLKDLFAVRGTLTTWGSGDFRERTIDTDSEVVVRLREAGAVLLAKLATGEFARGDRWYRGRTLNPWNREEGSSGSSAGPASATAAGCVAFGIGTETQGSIVSPARRCGLSALRPTFGRVSRHGGMVLAWSMDKVGPLCRTVEDCALVFSVIHGADGKDPASVTTPFRFERSPDLGRLRVGYDEDAPDELVDALRAMGGDPTPMPAIPDGGSNALSVESAAAFDFHVAPGGVLPPEPEPEPGERRRPGRFRGGRDVAGFEYVQSQRRRLFLMQEMADVMRDFDLFVSGSGHVRLTNQTGHPAVVLPYRFGRAGESEHEQPVCTTLIGRLYADDVILSVAHAFQARSDHHLHRPAL